MEPEKSNHPEHAVKEIQCVYDDVEQANKMLRDGWIYLGCHRYRVTENLGDEPSEKPAFILGKVK